MDDEPVAGNGADRPQATVEQRLSFLANLLFVAAALTVVVSLIAAVALATAQETLGGFETFERQSRDLAAIGALLAGIVGGGMLAGIGGILKAVLARSADERAGDTSSAPANPSAASPGTPSAGGPTR